MGFSFWGPIRLLNKETFHGGISWKLSFPRGCFIWYHNLSRSDRLFFLKTHQIPRGGSRAATTSKMERFVIIVNGLQPLTIITKRSILDVAAALDPPLGISSESISWKSDGDLFSGSPLDFRKRRFLWKDFVKTLTWRHPNQPWYCDF